MGPEDVAIQRTGDNRATWTDLHGGIGDIDVQRYFERRLPWPIEVEMWIIPVGASEGPHIHDERDPDGYADAREVYLIVEGQARVTLGGLEYTFGPGDAFMAGAHVRRGIANIGPSPLRIVIVNDPGPPLA